MQRAWRRVIITKEEVDQKLRLFAKIRPQCGDFQEAILEVLATVLSSPKFLYLSSKAAMKRTRYSRFPDYELAS